jgi:tetratricopeptide (TPR) repeat protein
LGEYLLDVRATDFRLFNTGVCLLRSGNHQKALDLLLSCRERNPGSLPVLFNLASAYLKLGEIEPALLVFGEVLRDSTSTTTPVQAYSSQGSQEVSAYAASLNGIAVAEWQQGHADLAIKALVGALDAQPDFISAKNNLNTLRNAR